MPTQSTFGAKTTADRDNLFAQLKAKGESITFRLVAPPAYDGKHFTKNPDSTYSVEDCPQIMTEEHCDKCEKYYALMREMRKAKAAKNNDEVKRIEEEARPYKAKITFYYPILNRDIERAQILKAPLSIRLDIDRMAQKIDVTKFDLTMERTEVPNKYYVLDRVDSSMSKALTERELIELEKAKTILERLNNKKESEQQLGEEHAPEGSESQEEPPTIHVDSVTGETVNPEDIPF